MKTPRRKLHQPPLTDDRRVTLASCLHPDLAAMVQMDGDSDGVSYGWIINDAIAAYYKQHDLRSTVIYQTRRAEKPDRQNVVRFPSRKPNRKAA